MISARYFLERLVFGCRQCEREVREGPLVQCPLELHVAVGSKESGHLSEPPAPVSRLSPPDEKTKFIANSGMSTDKAAPRRRLGGRRRPRWSALPHDAATWDKRIPMHSETGRLFGGTRS
ncbi:hypothetical protein Zmor_009242 [Zophobas morio]|uniref:Uncharacterized protein n=1 Tax=Zophobas morio TaxID=2755281 RepID=A0AA38IM78_9CUCU|nr:hypothetical protein Zmor_009242 [Zophobas morio]